MDSFFIIQILSKAAFAGIVLRMTNIIVAHNFSAPFSTWRAISTRFDSVLLLRHSLARHF